MNFVLLLAAARLLDEQPNELLVRERLEVDGARARQLRVEAALAAAAARDEVADLLDVVFNAVGEGHEGVAVDQELLTRCELRAHTGV